MLKIFLTGDNHIGLKYARHEKSTLLASNRMTVFENMVQIANDENCGMFAITGDLFDYRDSANKKEVAMLLDMLARFRGTVVVLPGNHDYYNQNQDAKVWKYFEDLIPKYDNILLLTAYHPYRLSVNGESVVLYPALCTSRHSLSGENNLGWIKEIEIQQDDSYHIGIAHGAVEGETIDNEGSYFIMKPSELENIPVDAWLIGHTHVPFPRNLTDNFTAGHKIFNAGTHVQTNVSCNTEGLCFIIEIDESKTVRAKKVVSGNLRFYRRNIALTAGTMEETLRRELSDIGDNSVVDLVLTGAVSHQEYEDREKIIENVLSRFIEGTYNIYGVTKVISEDVISSEFSETSFSARLLKALMDEPKEAQLAYELLKSLKGDK